MTHQTSDPRELLIQKVADFDNCFARLHQPKSLLNVRDYSVTPLPCCWEHAASMI